MKVDRAREDAGDDGGAGDRVQSARPRVAAARLRRVAREGASPTEAGSCSRSLEEDRFFLEQKKNAHLVLPNVTFTDRLTIDLGERADRGPARRPRRHARRHVPVSAGREDRDHRRSAGQPGVVRAQLLSHRLAAGRSRTIDALDAAVLVPGHGEPLRDKALLHATMDVMRELLKAGKDAKARGLDPDQAREEVFPRLHDLMVTITRDDPKANDAVQDLSRRLVPAPRLRRAERAAHRRDRADPAEIGVKELTPGVRPAVRPTPPSAPPSGSRLPCW